MAILNLGDRSRCCPARDGLGSKSTWRFGIAVVIKNGQKILCLWPVYGEHFFVFIYLLFL